MDGTKKIDELDIAKGIAIIAVVLGHSFPDADYGIANELANFIHSFVYGFHMPVFFFIAGLLSAKHKHNEPLPYIKKRAKKLLIPYFALSIVGLLLKQVFASEANHAYSISNVWRIVLGESPMGGMWYLWTLFVMSLAFILIIRFIQDDWRICLFGLSFHLIWLLCDTSFMHNFANFFVYFTLGVSCKSVYSKLKDLDHASLFCTSAIAYIIAVEFDVPALINGLLGIVMIISVSHMVESDWLEDIGQRSYSIYLMSYFIVIPIRVICYQRLNMNYWLVVALMFVGGLFVPYMISILWERIRQKRSMSLF